VNIQETLRTGAIALRNILIGGNIRCLGGIRHPRKIAELSTQNLFLYDSAFEIGLTKKNVKDVLPHNCFSDVKLFLDSEEFWINEMSNGAGDILSLCLIARLLRPGCVFEIGTLNGYTALHFAANAPEAEVYTLDLPPGSHLVLSTTVSDQHFAGESLKRPRLYQQHAESSRIHALYGDSAVFDFSPFHNKVDFFFIDGAHAYDYVRNDTLKALECCHPGSVIAWHDYGRRGTNGVSRWLHEFSQMYFPVYRIPNGSLAFGVVPDTFRKV
jgi:Methyltransferase domain